MLGIELCALLDLTFLDELYAYYWAKLFLLSFMLVTGLDPFTHRYVGLVPCRWVKS